MALPKIREQIEARVKDTGDTMTGPLVQTLNENPYYELKDGTNRWFFQAIKADNACYIGPTSTKALKIDTNGNTAVKGSLTVSGSIIGSIQEATKAIQDGNGNIITSTYLPLSGGTLTGNIEINKPSYPKIMIKDSGQGRYGEFFYNMNEEVIISNCKGENNCSLLFLRNENNINNLLQLSRVVNGQWNNYNIYGEHNKPTASDVGALPIMDMTDIDVDLNTVTKEGSYYIRGDNCINTPATDDTGTPTDVFTHGFLRVFNYNNVLMQELTITNMTAFEVHSRKTYIRVNSFHSGWTAWRRFAFIDEVLPLAGGTISNDLTVKGSTILESNVNVNGRLNVSVNYGAEGGEIALSASPDTPTQSGIILDQYYSRFRIFGIPSADGTTRTGPGTPLEIDPYEKSISGGYHVDFGTGNFNNLVVKHEANFLRNIVGNYGVIFRNDGESTYILLTNSGDPYGSWNNLRPLAINNQTGLVHIDNGLSVTATNAAEARARNISAGTSGSPANNGDIFIKYS